MQAIKIVIIVTLTPCKINNCTANLKTLPINTLSFSNKTNSPRVISKPTHSLEISLNERSVDSVGVAVDVLDSPIFSDLRCSRFEFDFIRLGKSAKIDNVSVDSKPYMQENSIWPLNVLSITKIPEIILD